MAALLVGVMLAWTTALGFAQDPEERANAIALTLREVGNSGQSGVASLAETPRGITFVAIGLDDQTPGVVRSAFIHEGTCASHGGVMYQLDDVVGGNSSTRLQVDLNTLKQQRFAITVHETPEAASPTVACAQHTPAGT
ncbi:MAG: hypothetical protein HY689_15335 [Chloroflexi bacterium]|nr:hypothetical protein [Chloroflexota bacterium]